MQEPKRRYDWTQILSLDQPEIEMQGLIELQGLHFRKPELIYWQRETESVEKCKGSKRLRRCWLRWMELCGLCARQRWKLNANRVQQIAHGFMTAGVQQIAHSVRDSTALSTAPLQTIRASDRLASNNSTALSTALLLIIGRRCSWLMQDCA